MSFFNNPSFYIQTAEADIVKFFATIKADVQIVEQDFLNVLQWLGAHGQEIATDVAGLIGIVAAAGVGIPAPVLGAATALNTAVSAVNAAIAAQQQQAAAGGGVGQQAISAASAAYQSLKNAQISTAQAQAHVASGASAQ